MSTGITNDIIKGAEAHFVGLVTLVVDLKNIDLLQQLIFSNNLLVIFGNLS